MSDAVHVERLDDHVALVELRRPDENFVDAVVLAELADAIDGLATGDCRAVVLASRGRHFCAGANLSAGAATEAAATTAAGADGRHIYDHAIRLFEQPIPVVAAIQGAAIGAGLGLAVAADFRVAAPETRFAANFTRLGFHHGFGLSVTLPRIVGAQGTLDLLYTGRRIDGEEALRLGLVDRLVPAGDLRAAAAALAADIAASAPLAVRSVRQTMRGDLPAAVRTALARERAEQEWLMATADFAEGVQAARERRTPRFVGA
jgi:enoyl-CoA hydratase/carnithine racemase